MDLDGVRRKDGWIFFCMFDGCMYACMRACVNMLEGRQDGWKGVLCLVTCLSTW